MQFCFTGGYTLSVVLSAGVCFAIFIIAFLFGLHLLIDAIRRTGDRTLLLTGTLTMWFWSLSYLAWGLRIILITADGAYLVIQPFAVQWTLYIGFGALFGVFWLIRMSKPELFEGRRSWLSIPFMLGTLAYAYFTFTSAFTTGDPLRVYHALVTDIAANPANPYGLGMLVVSAITLAIYVCIIPLSLYFLFMRQRRSLGKKVVVKDLIFWLGLLLISITAIMDLGLRYVPGMDLVTIAARALMAMGFFFLWFSYRLMNLFIK